jgi:metallo-beta-lactamase class B
LNKANQKKHMQVTLILSIAGLYIATISTAFGQDKNPPLTISHLTKEYYIYTTFGDAGNGDMFPANGMYLVTNRGVVLFDTPWDTTQFQPLLDSIMARHKQKVVMCISTHFHEDRTAGLTYYSQLGIKTYTTKQTDDLSKAKNKPRAEYLVYGDSTFVVGEHSFKIYYPGKGHSPDNIVIWFDKDKILHGGCFVKSMDTESVGNLSDADIDEWIKSVKKVQAKFIQPRFIIPGHQGWTSSGALKHTLKILERHRKQPSR